MWRYHSYLIFVLHSRSSFRFPSFLLKSLLLRGNRPVNASVEISEEFLGDTTPPNYSPPPSKSDGGLKSALSCKLFDYNTSLQLNTVSSIFWNSFSVIIKEMCASFLINRTFFIPFYPSPSIVEDTPWPTWTTFESHKVLCNVIRGNLKKHLLTLQYISIGNSLTRTTFTF